jgi:hypothetical protein
MKAMSARDDLLSFADGMHPKTQDSLRVLLERLELEWELDALERVRALADGLDGFRYKGVVMAARAAFPGRAQFPGLFGDIPQAAVCGHGVPFLLRGPNEQANDCQDCLQRSREVHPAQPVSFENTQTKRRWIRCGSCSRSVSWYNHTARRTT